MIQQPAETRRILLARSLAAAALITGLIAPGAVLAATGRDLTFGYTWRDSADGATRETATYDGAFNSTNPMNNSAPQGPITLGFTDPFPYYGTTVTTAYISDNGWLSFAVPGGAFPTPAAAMPSNALPNGGVLAPFWSDLTEDAPIDGDAVRWGRISSIDAFMIQYVGKDASNGFQLIWCDVILYSDGRIKFQYTSPGTVIGNATIGIENPAGNDGIQIAAGGATQPGVNFDVGYVIEFSPPLVLPSQCASIPSRGCTTFAGRLPGPGPGYALYYGCDTSRNEGREAVQSFTLTEPSAVTVTLNSLRAMRAYLLDACDERRCIRGPGTSFSVALGAGTYYVVVDAPIRNEEGDYSLNVACVPLGSPPLVCGATTTGTSAGGPNLWSLYDCSGATDYSGTESTQVVNVGTATNLSATLTTGGATQDVFILDAGPGEIGPDRCVATGDVTAVAWNAQPGTYLIVVDGGPAASGPYDLATDCRIQADCSTLEGSVDFAVARTQRISGDTSGALNGIDTYACDPSIVYDGPEHVYELTLAEDGLVGVYAYGLDPGVSVRFLDYCNEGSCAGTGAESACSALLTAGTHYLVVDGEAGAAGSYDLLVTFENQIDRWSECMDPTGTTMLTDTSRNFWNFDDYAFCPDVPNYRNYPDGCTFAMYLTANCGTALHIPLYDSESGHVRVFDLFRGEYVELTAVSGGGWFSSGTDIQWRSTDCELGSDARYNEVVTDVYFERPDGLCGIYRLEFPNHSGFVWELYSNCTGAQSPGFEIHDSLCTALANYSPLPGVTLDSATATFNCPDITVTYTVRNNGCVPVTDFPVQVLDGTTVVGTDIVPSLDSGESRTITFTATFPATPTGNVTLRADPGDVVLECTEAPDFSCSAAVDVDIIQLPGCTGVCNVIANAIATPAATCVGAPVTVDGSSSSASLCPGGVLEYQLRGPGAPVGWQLSPSFPGISPTTTADYDLDVRCQGMPSCLDSDQVTIPVERPPLLDPLSVQASDNAPCNLGVVVNWDAATFYGASRTGAYNVYRSETSCAAALAAGPIIVGLAVPGYADSDTVAGGTYYYVIEAEDSDPGSACVPAGPRNGGAATRVAANFGACVAIVDDSSVRPDLLPRIGGTLRAGGDFGDGTPRYGQSFCEFNWTVDSPLDPAAGEHYHLHRSAQPDAGFARLTDDLTLLQFEGYTDYGADHADDTTYCWYYKAFVADSCDNENSAFDGGNE